MKLRIIIMLLVIPVLSDCQSLNDRLYNCYINEDMSDWPIVMREMKDIYVITGSYEMLYDLTVAQYGFIAFSIKNDKKNEARPVMKRAELNIEKLLAIEPNSSNVHALRGALLALKVALAPYKAPFLVGKSAKANEYALELGPKNPKAWMEKGNMDFFKPDFVGKDVDEAKKSYAYSVELFEKDPRDLEGNWLYLNTLFCLASAYRDAGDYKDADRVYRKMLVHEPDIVWVRDRVYPRFKRKYRDAL